MVKIVIGHKGKSKTVELKDIKPILGLKIGDTFKGEIIDFSGYEFEITGGSDNAGFAMRKDIEGTSRKKILAVQGVGLKKKAKGLKQRKTVAGNTVYQGTAAINVKIVKEGKTPIFESENKEENSEENSKENNEEKESKEEVSKEENKE